MNYRHAYHAGNVADCLKHALLILLLRAMMKKPKPFLVLDTHAGIGTYDLTTGPATKTGEWQQGIGRLLTARPPELADFLATIEALGLYPGSPAIAAALLRPTDRLIACELHPEDAHTLKRNVAGHKNIAVHERDGYQALRAFLPPPERRALVLIDPPFERADEFLVLAKHLIAAYEKFPTGVYAAWYPIKHRAPVRQFFETLQLSKLRDTVAASFWQREPVDPMRLNGSGLLVVNPPFRFEAAAAPVLSSLVDTLGESSSGYSFERLIDE
jgi:23S rRNA (adenine2030-N6)-methyltransferase